MVQLEKLEAIEKIVKNAEDEVCLKCGGELEAVSEHAMKCDCGEMVASNMYCDTAIDLIREILEEQTND